LSLQTDLCYTDPTDSEAGATSDFCARASNERRSAPRINLRIHLWVHELLAAPGGIQAYSTHLLEALCWVVGPHNLRVFSKNDTALRLQSAAPPGFTATGSWPRRIRSAVFAARALAASLKNRPHLVILTHLNFSPIAYWLACTRRTPYWCIAHGVEAWGLDHRGRIRGLRGAARVLAVSSYTRSRVLAEQAIEPDRVGILPNTFRPDAFRPGPKPEGLLARHELSAGKKVILTVARLSASERYKGYDQVIRAMPQILAAIPKAHYVIVGDGGDRARIKQLVGSLGISRSVTMAGAVKDSELPEYYNLCDVFAMPSKGEGFGIVFLEALACGKPVLAGNTDGSRDPLQDGRVGVLVNPDSVSDIAQALVAILARTYQLPVLYRPDELRARTIQAFGRDRFLRELWSQLQDLDRCD
jgi:glycosyltransferase involved in cell wall biosynthesis